MAFGFVCLFGSAPCFWFHLGFKGKTDVALMWQCEFIGLFVSATHGLMIFKKSAYQIVGKIRMH